jgi:hypothetical protein
MPDDADWYASDLEHGGTEMKRWAGVEYETPGGQEVGKMVKALWDPRGWECIWVSNLFGCAGTRCAPEVPLAWLSWLSAAQYVVSRADAAAACRVRR